MPEYWQDRVESGTYFFTLALADRRSELLVPEVAALRASVERARALYPFNIEAWVVLLSTCMRYGRCRRATLISRRDGLV